MSGHVGFVVDKTAMGQVFFEYFGFPYQSFHRLLHTHHHSVYGAGKIGQTVTDVPSGLSQGDTTDSKTLYARKTSYSVTVMLRLRAFL
jgi:hypothetical protein